MISIPNQTYIVGRLVQYAGAWQVDIRNLDSVYIAGHSHHRWSHPAKVFEFVELNPQPLAILEAPTHAAGIPGVQIGRV